MITLVQLSYVTIVFRKLERLMTMFVKIKCYEWFCGNGENRNVHIRLHSVNLLLLVW